jgi:hypothetical protein
MELCEVIGIVLTNGEIELVFPCPFASLGNKTFGKVSV